MRHSVERSYNPTERANIFRRDPEMLNFSTKLTAMREAAEEQGNHLHLDRSAEPFLHAIVGFSTSQLHKGPSHSVEINHKILRP